jgi:hypothetical protein
MLPFACIAELDCDTQVVMKRHRGLAFLLLSALLGLWSFLARAQSPNGCEAANGHPRKSGTAAHPLIGKVHGRCGDIDRGRADQTGWHGRRSDEACAQECPGHRLGKCNRFARTDKVGQRPLGRRFQKPASSCRLDRLDCDQAERSAKINGSPEILAIVERMGKPEVIRLLPHRTQEEARRGLLSPHDAGLGIGPS